LKTATDTLLYARRIEQDDSLPPGLPSNVIAALEGPVWQVETQRGEPVCLGGFLPSQEVLRCSAWWWPFGDIHWASPFRLCGAIQRTIVAHQTEHGCYRIEAHVLSGWRPAQVLVKACGFVYEGTMKRWGPAQEDFDLYRWEPRR